MNIILIDINVFQQNYLSSNSFCQKHKKEIHQNKSFIDLLFLIKKGNSYLIFVARTHGMFTQHKYIGYCVHC